ncbi:unnamed protein product [Oikopleura dioica]|uniref:Uncharacterized protein n=1 Tax=Oikopleura dioica TaxID=34765 RepID=E4XLP7_OIKDI|nr:unnamed protein product [Oikopleura dioica]
MPRQNHPAIVCPRSISFFDTVRLSRFLLLLSLGRALTTVPSNTDKLSSSDHSLGTAVSLLERLSYKTSWLQIISRLLPANMEHSQRIMRILHGGSSWKTPMDYQTFLDLRKLEERINTQQWTSSDHWAEVAARYGPHGTHL